MAASTLAMTAYLSKSRSIVMFPEGTWNLTENRLMLPMKWGVIDVAQESGGQIVPTVLEYRREQKLFYSVEEYPPINWSYESSCIYHPHTEPEDVWQSVVNIKNVHAGNIT